MEKTYRAAIFDLDGTLIDSLHDLYLSANAALRGMGFEERTEDEVRQFVGNGVGMLIQRAVPAGTSEEATSQCLAIFKQHYVAHCRDHTAPYDGILPLLRQLRVRGVRTAIVSNKLQAGVDELAEEHFQGLVDAAIGERPGILRKPSPGMVDEAVARLGVLKSECLYIGDSEVDVLTARNAAIDAVAVLWGFRSRQQLLEAGAHCFVEAPEELLRFFPK